MRFFACDAHISVVTDAAHILRNLGHEVNDEQTLSGHTWVMPGKKRTCTLEYYGWNLREDNLQKFYDKYKTEFDQYDAFIVAYPISWCMFWLKWNKPIICIVCVRYEMPFTAGPEDWAKFNDLLRNHKQNKLFIHCNNKGDRDYLKHYTGLNVPHITSLCEYVGVKHNPSKANDTFARFARNGGLDEVSNTRGLPWGGSWENMYASKAAVHIPFHNGCMSLYEHYTANLPIFAPTKRLMWEWRWPINPIGVFSEINWYRVSKIPEPKDNSPNNAQDPVWFNWWADRCDVFDNEVMPFIIHFDSVQDYINKQSSTNYAQVSEQMRRFNVIKKERVYSQWREILHNIEQCRR